MCALSCAVMWRWGSDRAKASRLAWSSQTESVQSVFAISWACSP
jgi:hypothetical protein